MVDVKSEPDGSVLGFSGVVSAVFADYFYVVDVEGISGIRVEYPPAGIAEGATVYVSGTVQTNAAGERFVDAASVGT